MTSTDQTNPAPAEPAPLPEEPTNGRPGSLNPLEQVKRDVKVVYDQAGQELDAALKAKSAVSLRVAKARAAHRNAQQAARALGVIPGRSTTKAVK